MRTNISEYFKVRDTGTEGGKAETELASKRKKGWNSLLVKWSNLSTAVNVSSVHTLLPDHVKLDLNEFAFIKRTIICFLKQLFDWFTTCENASLRMSIEKKRPIPYITAKTVLHHQGLKNEWKEGLLLLRLCSILYVQNYQHFSAQCIALRHHRNALSLYSSSSILDFPWTLWKVDFLCYCFNID